MQAEAGDHDPNTSITFLGHSTVLMAIDGIRVLSDPVLRPRVGPLVRTAPLPEAEHWASIDAVVISHSHWDHLDYGSLRLVGSGTRVIVPRGMAPRLRVRGFSSVVELEPMEQVRVGPVTIEATHAEHRGFGPPIGGTDRSIGYLLRGSHCLYFAGDTAYFEAMAQLAADIDVALIPVWGWGPNARSGEHLDPLGAARALSLIKPRIAVPIHWGTLHPIGLRWLRPSTRIDPPHQFAQLARRFAPETQVRVLPVGARLTLDHGARS